MANRTQLTVEFITPDDVGEENVRHVLDQFLADLEQTDRFERAIIRDDDDELSDGEAERLVEMLDDMTGEDCTALEQFIDQLQDE